MAFPSATIQQEITQIQLNLINSLSVSDHLLNHVARYYAELPSKRLRPRLVLLMARATNRSGVVLQSQSVLAEIAEMVHIASLLHDDVVDQAETRRGAPSAPSEFGNKMAILGGDFIIARMLTRLADIKNHEVTREIGEIIMAIVTGEYMQLSSSFVQPLQRLKSELFDEKCSIGGVELKFNLRRYWEEYMFKTYLKTASFFARALYCTAILSQDAVDSESETFVHGDHSWIANAYGTNLGMAFQLVDDALDCDANPNEKLGKPSNGADLRLGLITAPVLFAIEERPDVMLPLVQRRFSEPGDTEQALSIIRKSSALDRTRALAEVYARRAWESVSALPPSNARDELQRLASEICKRVA